MIEASCHCGAVRVRLDAAPTELTECNCTICRRYGVLWAYCAADAVTVSGETDAYVREGGDQGFHRCRTCGCVTHWAKLAPGFPRVGINARLLDPEVVAGAVVHHLDGLVTDEYLD